MTAHHTKKIGSSLAAMFAAGGVVVAAHTALAQSGPVNAPVAASASVKAPVKTPVIENHYGVSLNNPLLPFGVIGALGGAALLVGGYAQRRRMKIAIPYVLACGTAVTLLLNPEIITEKHEKIPTEVIVAIDKSPSQGIIKSREQATAAMQAELTKALSALGNVNIRVVEIDAARSANGTQLFSSFNGLSDLDPKHVGAVFSLTDGQIDDVPASSPFRKDGPVHGLLSGQPGETDRVIKTEISPRYGLVGQDQTLRVRVEDLGGGSVLGKPVTLNVKGEGGEVQTIEALTGESVEVKVKIGHVGPNVVSIDAQGLDGELSTANNQIVASIQGIQEAINVLLISGTVNSSTVPLRDIFKSDPDSNLIHTMVLRLPQDFDDTPAEELSLIPFPMKLVGASLPKFDLVVFDHYPNMNVIPQSYMNGIADHVKGGGALMVLAGSEFAGSKSLIRSPIGTLLPVRPNGNILEEEAPPKASIYGQRHPILRGLPGMNATAEQEPGWGPWVHVVEAAQNGGTSLLESSSGKPLLVLDRVEKGRVAVLLSDEGLNLWKMGYQGGGPHADLLRRVSHWLMKNPNMEEEALRMTSTDDGRKLVIERRTMAESTDPVSVVTPSGETLSVTLQQKSPGVWQAELATEKTGVYQARQDGAETLVAYTNVGPANARELERLISTDEKLAPLAKATGGVVARMQDAKGNMKAPVIELLEEGEKPSAEGVMGIRRNTKTLLKGSDETPLIPGWLGALLIAGLTAYGWMREGDPKKVRKALDSAFGRDNIEGPQGPAAGV